MLKFVSLLVLAFAVSLDGFGVGVTYGLRKIRIPFRSVTIISGFSALVILISMQIGVWLKHWISPEQARWVGAIILMGIGCWTLYQMTQTKEEEVTEDAYEKTLVEIEIKWLGLVVHILKKPTDADRDRSGIISPSEATLLGAALSLDAFGAGIGAAFIGFAPWITALVIALMSGAFLMGGLRFGWIFSDQAWLHRLAFLPGCLLIIIGLSKLI